MTENLPDSLPSVNIRRMRRGEVVEVIELVRKVFLQFEAPDYTVEGVEEFFRYANPEALLTRAANHLVLVCLVEERIAGMIEIRNHAHISLLFVGPAYQQRGLARRVLERAIAICRRDKPDFSGLTVNSSPYAVPIYRKLGFQETSPECSLNGIRFIPMQISLK